jgi:hypothetical protein
MPDEHGPAMTVEQLAIRYAERPGFHLADFLEVALPIYRLTISAFSLSHKRITATQEAVLKCSSIGLTDPGEISSFLGLPAAHVADLMTMLFTAELLTLTPQEGELNQKLSLTRRGKEVLRKAEIVTPEERTYVIKYDTLLRAPVEIADERLLSARAVKAASMKAFPSLWNRPVDTHDLDIGEVQKVVRLGGGAREIGRRLLAIRSIERRQRQYRPAVALIYRSDTGGEVEVGFVINGSLSTEYEDAFMRAHGVRNFRIDRDIARMRAVAEDTIGRYLSSIAGERQEVVFTAQEWLRTLRASTEQPSRIRVVNLTPRVEADLANHGVAPLYVHDHPPLLRAAVSCARQRVLIISPWITDAVVDQQFLKDLAGTLRRGVEVYIGYGLSEDAEARRTTTAVKALKELAVRFPQFRLREFGDTHAKVLLCDRDFVVVTSFNWLSFRGDPSRGFRDEQGTLIALPDIIERAFNQQLDRFK